MRPASSSGATRRARRHGPLDSSRRAVPWRRSGAGGHALHAHDRRGGPPSSRGIRTSTRSRSHSGDQRVVMNGSFGRAPGSGLAHRLGLSLVSFRRPACRLKAAVALGIEEVARSTAKLRPALAGGRRPSGSPSPSRPAGRPTLDIGNGADRLDEEDLALDMVRPSPASRGQDRSAGCRAVPRAASARPLGAGRRAPAA